MPSQLRASQRGDDIHPLGTIYDVREVRQPSFTKRQSRGRGAVRRGHLYESRFGDHLRSLFEPNPVRLSQWLAYELLDGLTRYAQPDAYVVCPHLILLFECKLSQVPRAEAQLRHLYGPLLEFHYDRPAVLVQVCRSLRERPSSLVTPAQFHLLEPSLEQIHTWHLMI